MIALQNKTGFCNPAESMISDHAKSWALSEDWLTKLKISLNILQHIHSIWETDGDGKTHSCADMQ